MGMKQKKNIEYWIFEWEAGELWFVNLGVVICFLPNFQELKNWLIDAKLVCLNSQPIKELKNIFILKIAWEADASLLGSKLFFAPLLTFLITPELIIFSPHRARN